MSDTEIMKTPEWPDDEKLTDSQVIQFKDVPDSVRRDQGTNIGHPSVSVIGESLHFKGELSAGEDLIIEGTVEGGNLVITNTAGFDFSVEATDDAGRSSKKPVRLSGQDERRVKLDRLGNRAHRVAPTIPRAVKTATAPMAIAAPISPPTNAWSSPSRSSVSTSATAAAARPAAPPAGWCSWRANPRP